MKQCSFQPLLYYVTMYTYVYICAYTKLLLIGNVCAETCIILIGSVPKGLNGLDWIPGRISIILRDFKTTRSQVTTSQVVETLEISASRMKIHKHMASPYVN